MIQRRYFKFLPVALALVLICAWVPLSYAGDEKKPEEKSSSSKKSDEKGEKKPEAKSGKPDGSATDAGKDATKPASPSIYSRAVRKPDPDVKVFTNEDLGQAAAAPEGAVTDAQSSDIENRTLGGATDPLAWMKEQENRAVERREMVKTAEASLAAARMKLENLQKQLLATVNPFAARPELSDEEKELRATSGETAEQRNARTNTLVEEAQKEVAAAQQRLARVKAQR